MLRLWPALPALLLLAAACSSPLVRAAKQGRTDEILSVLPSERKHCGAALSEAAARNHEDALKALLDGGCDVDSKDSDGYTALMSAAAKGYDGCVRLLLERKADVDLRSWNDKTAAMLARRAGHKDTVKLLESLDGLPLPPAVKTPAPKPGIPAPAWRASESLRGEAIQGVSVGRLAASPREYMHKLVLIRGRVQKIVAANGKQYGFGLAEPGKVYAGTRGSSEYSPLTGEKYLSVASMAVLIDAEGGKCAFIFQEGMRSPPAGQAVNLTGRYLGDRLRAGSLAPGVYLEAAGVADEATFTEPELPKD